MSILTLCVVLGLVCVELHHGTVSGTNFDSVFLRNFVTANERRDSVAQKIP